MPTPKSTAPNSSVDAPVVCDPDGTCDCTDTAETTALLSWPATLVMLAIGGAAYFLLVHLFGA